jgi:hypothetical protein
MNEPTKTAMLAFWRINNDFARIFFYFQVVLFSEILYILFNKLSEKIAMRIW